MALRSGSSRSLVSSILSYVLPASILLASVAHAAPPPVAQQAISWKGDNFGKGSVEVINAESSRRTGCLNGRGRFVVAPDNGPCPMVFLAGGNLPDDRPDVSLVRTVIMSLNTKKFCGWKDMRMQSRNGNEIVDARRRAWSCDRDYGNAEWLLHPNGNLDLSEYSKQLQFSDPQGNALHFPFQIVGQPPSNKNEQQELLYPLLRLTPPRSQAYFLRWVRQSREESKTGSRFPHWLRDHSVTRWFQQHV